MNGAARPGPTDPPATWGRMTMCETLGPSHAFLQRSGQLRLLLRGNSLEDLLVEGARAIGDRLCGQARPAPAGPWLDVEIHADGQERVLGAWLNRLLYLAGRNRWASVESELIALDEGGLHARVRGVTLGAIPPLGRAAILPGSLSSAGGRGLQAEVVLGPVRPAPRRRARGPKGVHSRKGGT